MIFKNEKFIKCLEQHIIYRTEQSKIKITDLVLEEIITFSLEDSNVEHTYNSGSHSPGCDIKILNNALSVKSGKETKDKLTISSFRLSRFNDNINDMINYIDNDGKNFDYYIILSRLEDKTKICYNLYIIPSNIFICKELKWNKIKNDYKANDDNIFLKIVKNQSSELWITFKKEFIEKYKYISIVKNKNELGINRFKANPY